MKHPVVTEHRGAFLFDKICANNILFSSSGKINVIVQRADNFLNLKNTHVFSSINWNLCWNPNPLVLLYLKYNTM